MSHFAVLVVMDEKPTEESLSPILAPWHEFECTGIDDQYVQNVDILAQAREEFAKTTATLVVQRLDGSKVYAFSGGNYIDELRPFYNSVTRDLTLPEGWVELKDEKASDWENFQTWANGWYGMEIVEGDAQPDLEDKHKYGWCRVVDGEVTELVDRTNPNKKWDWWVIGGRYGGRLRAKDANAAVLGKKGAFGRSSDEGVDIVQKSNLDFDAMRAYKVDVRMKGIEAALAKLAEQGVSRDETLAIWKAYSEHGGWTAVVDAWKAGGRQGRPHDLLATYSLDNPLRIAHEKGVSARLGDGLFECASVPDDQPDPIAWANSAPAITTWAVVKDGIWSEKGEMGWFGMSSGDMNEGDWETIVDKVIADLPDTAWIAVVDCHI
jgi:hypothetical protein